MRFKKEKFKSHPNNTLEKRVLGRIHQATRTGRIGPHAKGKRVGQDCTLDATINRAELRALKNSSGSFWDQVVTPHEQV